jgi:hypothetical protein
MFLGRFEKEPLFRDKNIVFSDGVFLEILQLGKSELAKAFDNNDNLPGEFNRVGEKLYELWRKERLNDQDGSDKLTSDTVAKKSFIKRDFVVRLVMAIYYHLQRTHRFFEEIEVPFYRQILESGTFTEAFDLWVKSELVLKSQQNLHVPLENITSGLSNVFTRIVDELDSSALPNNAANDNEIVLRLDEFKSVLAEYKKFQKELYILNKTVPADFLYYQTFKGLSSGEKAYYDFFARFNSALERIVRRIEAGDYLSKKLTFYLLIDEGEIGFHLRWQREYVKDMIEYLPKILHLKTHQIKIQIIFTTHSPISLSDIPSSHIIYLSKCKEGLINASNDLDLLTFGANVQKLMAHSFFMEKGAVGEFAQGRIQDLINLLNSDKVDDDDYGELLKRLELIGEPLIVRKLREKLYSRNPTARQKRIQDLEEEIRKLKENDSNF